MNDKKVCYCGHSVALLVASTKLLHVERGENWDGWPFADILPWYWTKPLSLAVPPWVSNTRYGYGHRWERNDVYMVLLYWCSFDLHATTLIRRQTALCSCVWQLALYRNEIKMKWNESVILFTVCCIKTVFSFLAFSCPSSRRLLAVVHCV